MPDNLSDQSKHKYDIVEVREDGSALRNDCSDLRPAISNKWYALMTLHGEQVGQNIDYALHERNRKVWNAWSCQSLDDVERSRLAEFAGVDLFELSAWNELYDEVVGLFQERLGETTALPSVDVPINLGTTLFSKRLNLQRMIFPQKVAFSSSNFMRATNFESAVFVSKSYFTGSSFDRGASANFSKTLFEATTFFEDVRFLDGAIFEDAHFASDVELNRIEFEGEANFASVHFGDTVFFSESKFRVTGPWLAKSVFSGDALFRNCQFIGDSNFECVRFSGSAIFDESFFAGEARFNSSTFEGASQFRSAWFRKKALFRDADFRRPTSFRGAAFEFEYPVFEEANLNAKTQFTAVESVQVSGQDAETTIVRAWPEDPPDIQNARDCVATIRHVLGQQGLPEEEHFFFRKEMEFTSRIVGPVRRLPYKAFQLISDFGYSIQRPFVALVLTVGVGWFVLLIGSCAFASTITCGPESAGSVFALSFTNTFSLFGFHRLYFGAAFLTELASWMKIIGACQTVLGFVFLFFLGLGLRTRFRLR